jgi:DNA-binding NarL/FixJ family response regulator
VDDLAMVQRSLRFVLDVYDDLDVVAEARDGAEAVELVKLVEDLRPSVVVLNINMSASPWTAKMTTATP